MFAINGKKLPSPGYGMAIERQQFVSEARNAQGQVVAQKINRRIDKLSSLTWGYLTAEEWRSIQVEIDKFEGELTYWDNVSGTFITRRVYWGDESATPLFTDSTGRVLSYVNCTCNIIDMGYNPEDEEEGA